MRKLKGAGIVLGLFALGCGLRGVVAQPRPEAEPKKQRVATGNAELAVKQQAMIDAAQRTLAALEESFAHGKLLPNEVYVWSSHIRSSQVRAANAPQQVTNACQEHLKRMQELHRRIAALAKQGMPGGEKQQLYATQFYVAEAEVLLMEAGGMEGGQRLPGSRGR